MEFRKEFKDYVEIVILVIILVINSLIIQVLQKPSLLVVFVAFLPIWGIDALLKAVFKLDTMLSYADLSFASLVHIAPMIADNSPINWDGNPNFTGPFEDAKLLAAFILIFWIVSLRGIQIMRDASGEDLVNRRYFLIGKIIVTVFTFLSYSAAVISEMR